MDNRLLEIVVCPICHGKLHYQHQELICSIDALAFPIQDGIPVLLENEARPLNGDEKLP